MRASTRARRAGQPPKVVVVEDDRDIVGGEVQVAFDRVVGGDRRLERGERVFRAAARGIVQAAMRDRPGRQPAEIFSQDDALTSIRRGRESAASHQQALRLLLNSAQRGAFSAARREHRFHDLSAKPACWRSPISFILAATRRRRADGAAAPHVSRRIAPSTTSRSRAPTTAPACRAPTGRWSSRSPETPATATRCASAWSSISATRRAISACSISASRLSSRATATSTTSIPARP